MSPSDILYDKLHRKGNMKQKSIPMRVKESTLKLIRMYAGQLQTETGESVSDDDAIREVFKRFLPEVVNRMEEIFPQFKESTEREDSRKKK
jgi:hypothetical protein